VLYWMLSVVSDVMMLLQNSNMLDAGAGGEAASLNKLDSVRHSHSRSRITHNLQSQSFTAGECITTRITRLCS